MMKPTIIVVRAVGAEFVRRVLRPWIFGGTVLAALLLVVGGWLITVNVWWWLLEIALVGAGLLFALLVLVVAAILRKIESPLSPPQRRLVVDFADKLERSIESVRTPYPAVIYYIVRDIVRPKPKTFIGTVIHDSKTLGPDFARLRKELSERN